MFTFSLGDLMDDQQPNEADKAAEAKEEEAKAQAKDEEEAAKASSEDPERRS